MRVVTFGEIMLRLAPNGYYRFFQNDQMQATFGGGEANVAVSLANYGVDSVYVTKLPEHAIGQGAVDSLRYFGIDTSKIVRGGDRVGIYFIEKGASQRSSLCIYDRAHSSIATADVSDFDWDDIFDGVQWFHFTGITPALGGNVRQICLQACKKARERGITISFDPNYRSKLWTVEEATPIISQFCEYADVLIVNENQAQQLFGLEIPGHWKHGDETDDDGYKWLCERISERFGNSTVILSERRTYSAEVNRICGKIYTGGEFATSKQYEVQIVDRVGGGDALAAGMIYSLISEYSPKQAIEFAVAASALKHSVEGDYNRVSVSEVEKLAGGDGSGRVQR